MDTYGGGFALLWVALWEMIAVMWIYGVRNFCADLEHMLGFKPSRLWQVCWAMVSPIFLAVILTASLATWENPKGSIQLFRKCELLEF